MRTARALVIVVFAMCVFSLAAAGVAQAEPYWSIAGEKLEASQTATITNTSDVSRLWSAGLSLVIECQKDKMANGELEGGAVGKGKTTSITYESCTVNAATKAAGKWEVGNALGACKVSSPGKALGEIVTKELSFMLAYDPSFKLVVVDFKPKAGSVLAEIVISGEFCAVKQTAELKGSVIAIVTPQTLEAPMHHLEFTVYENGANEVINLYEEYENEKKETFADTLEFATKPAGYEGLETVQLKSKKSYKA